MKEKFSGEEKIKKELEIQKNLTSFYKDLSNKLQKLVDDLISH